jgi:hypothetical protein
MSRDQVPPGARCGAVTTCHHDLLAGAGSAATVSPGTNRKYGRLRATFLPGMMIYAGSSDGSTGPQLLYRRSGRPTCAFTSRARTT